MKKKNSLAFMAIFMFLLYGCGNGLGGGSIISTPIENISNTPLKFEELSEAQKQHWHFMDLASDTVPGMSVDLAYNTLIKNKKGKTTIVAIIDSGIDITHEDLDGVIWENKDEIPNNGRDDDNNGYIDDIHGWNFLGDAYQEQMEYTRILASNNTSHPKYSEALEEYNSSLREYTNLRSNIEQIQQEVLVADKAVSQYLGKESYTKEELMAIDPKNASLERSIAVLKYVLSLGFESVEEGIEGIENELAVTNEWLDYRLNKSFNGRTTGDDINDITDTDYGNNNVQPVAEDESHGTNVAGLIAAERNNAKGIKGVSNNVLIMPLRVVSNADEYDKDVALAIRYAVDNGADIINGSFGKYFSPHPKWVQDAIKYAAKNDVLIVQAAGNEGFDSDKNITYPNDIADNSDEIADNFINVGAIVPKYGSSLVASYSNYGQKNVDVFAPGTQVYTTDLNNSYDFVDGTSFASPNVAGVAAVVLSHFPNLSASQLKSILIESGLPINIKVSVGGESNNVRDFKTLSKSGKIVNLYNALLFAERMSPN